MEDKQKNVKFIKLITNITYNSEKDTFIYIKSTTWKNKFIQKTFTPKEIKDARIGNPIEGIGKVPFQEKIIYICFLLIILFSIFFIYKKRIKLFL